MAKTEKKAAAKKTVAKKCCKSCAAKKPTAKKEAAKSVTFSIHAEKGKEVYLAGEFNDWNPKGKKMSFKNGVYSTSLKLAAGMYQYKFVIDGTWCADPENINAVPNDQGTFNSVIAVK